MPWERHIGVLENMGKEMNSEKKREHNRFCKGKLSGGFWKIRKSWKLKINNGSKGITNERTACVQRMVEISVDMCAVPTRWRHWNENSFIYQFQVAEPDHKVSVP